MPQETASHPASTLKKIDFAVWQYGHAHKGNHRAATGRLIRARMHGEAPIRLH